MEKVNLGYSAKNIPIPTNNSYLKAMITKIKSFVKRLRWKAFFDRNDDCANADTTKNYGFKSERTPLQHDGLLAFEADLYRLAKTIKFRYVRNQFQTKFAEDAKCIKNSEQVFVPADKSTNLYKISPIQYKKLLSNSITTSYQKIKHDSILLDIDKEAKKIAQNLKLEDRIECFPHQEAFVTPKDHKENFYKKPSCHLINPAKSELGKIAKFHIDKTNSIIRAKTKLRQWRSTKEVIAWFESLENKQKCKFIKFDIAEFYPSISDSL